MNLRCPLPADLHVALTAMALGQEKPHEAAHEISQILLVLQGGGWVHVRSCILSTVCCGFCCGGLLLQLLCNANTAGDAGEEEEVNLADMIRKQEVACLDANDMPVHGDSDYEESDENEPDAEVSCLRGG